MIEYRAYILGQDGHIINSRGFACENDDDATVWAQQLADCHDVELWSGARFVLRLDAKQQMRTDQAREVLEEYASDQREIIRKLRRTLKE